MPVAVVSPVNIAFVISSQPPQEAPRRKHDREFSRNQKAFFLDTIRRMAEHYDFVEHSRSSADEVVSYVYWLDESYVILDRGVDDDGVTGRDPTKPVWAVELHKGDGDEDELNPTIGFYDLHATDALRIAAELASHYARR